MAMTDEGLETVARWMGQRGYATGHGDTIEDLLYELEGQVAELTIKKLSEVLLDKLRGPSE
jgi:hypothetical protein